MNNGILAVLEWQQGSINDVVIQWLKTHKQYDYVFILEKLWFTINGYTWLTYDYECCGNEVIIYADQYCESLLE